MTLWILFATILVAAVFISYCGGCIMWPVLSSSSKINNTKIQTDYFSFCFLIFIFLNAKCLLKMWWFVLDVVLLEALLVLVSAEDEGDEDQVISCYLKLRAYKT